MTKKRHQSSGVIPMLLQFERFSIRSEHDSFKEYIVDNRNSIKKQQDEFNKMIEKRVAQDPSNADEIYDWYLDQYHQYTDFYPALFNSSTLLSIYSSFEFN